MTEFRIADTFTDSLARLTAQEQKAAKTTAFDLQLNPSAPGLSFHRLDRAKDTNFWSVRVNADIRIIVHRTQSSILLVYVDHHDDAYKWAERRKIERHPTTGAMQLVEVRERVEESRLPAATSARQSVTSPKPRLFDNLRKLEIMSFGVPEEWVEAVRAATEDTLFDILQHLPQEAQEALLKLAVGEAPEVPTTQPIEADPFAHPDAQRRFRLLANAEDLAQALEYPWEKWAVFLHPAQQALVERQFNGPARVTGSAGTGKTIVALHRAVHLARSNPDARVLLTTFSNPLAHSLRAKLKTLVSLEPAIDARITVKPISAVGYDLYSLHYGQPQIASPTLVASLLSKASREADDARFSHQFLLHEWSDVVDAWNLKTWDDYRDVARLGRRTRVGGRQREQLWSIFQRVREGLAERNSVTWSDVFGRLTADMATGRSRPFDFAVVDEAQDLSVAEVRFLAALTSERPNGVFLAGDIGQRIFQQPFSWKLLGLDVRGRSTSLKINYRTSHQIRSHADRLLPGAIADVDGNKDHRRGTISTFDGPSPAVLACHDTEEEIRQVGSWISKRVAEGFAPAEIAILVRSDKEISRARSAVKFSGNKANELGEKASIAEGMISIGLMHDGKGLEFRAVAVMACDEDVVPSLERLAAVADAGDLAEAYDTERHLLYVAFTRARDMLLVSGVVPVSEFLKDIT